MTETDWYDGSIKPVRSGVYERKTLTHRKYGYAYFGNGKWAWDRDTPESARHFADRCSDFQSSPWRGLTEPHCYKCATPMAPRAAIEQTYRGVGDFGRLDIVTLSPGGPGKLVACYKCLTCGWSVSK